MEIFRIADTYVSEGIDYIFIGQNMVGRNEFIEVAFEIRRHILTPIIYIKLCKVE